MSRKHKRILAAIFEDPVRSDITWAGIETLLKALGLSFQKGAAPVSGSLSMVYGPFFIGRTRRKRLIREP